ncbi:microfibril-associated glycoprotein 4-like [Saccostrea cucullata]|uniref:microfibril-associated glycoprotein 4-like n=1 Tax=Saccostrea cuccullata TaxID=36930 RepID=UPI002ED4BC6C
MGALCAIVLVLIFFDVCQSTIISRKYTAQLELNDEKSNEEPLGEHNSTSVIECAARCQRECSIFGFHSQMKKCRTHKRNLMSEVSNEDGWRYYSHDFTPIDCKDLQSDGYFNSGVYEIYPYGTITSPVQAYCDMTTMGGGWTAIQKRINGTLDFDRTWTEYKNGFGAPEQDVWVGNDVIHQLTKEGTSSLYVTITLQNGTTLYETYDRFSVSDEAGKYQLFLAGPATGTLGDSMLDTGNPNRDLSGMSFTTPDRDNDRASLHCATVSYTRGGWWFNACHAAFLNGQWSPESWYNPWSPTVTSGTSVRGTTMMIRRN